MVEIASPRRAQVNFMMPGKFNCHDGIMIKKKPCELYAEAGSICHLLIWL